MIHAISTTQLAIQYAIDNPVATPSEIEAMFAIRPCDATYAYNRGVDARRTDWPLKPVGKAKRPLDNKPALAAARKWALENKCSCERDIYKKWNITSMQAKAIAKETTAAKKSAAPQTKRHIEAKEYLEKNRKFSSYQIAKKFGVSADYVKRQRRLMLEAEREARRWVEPKGLPKRLNRLRAVMSDGSMVDPKLVRDLKSVVRFEKVVI
jgi:hypothetical protein